MPVQAISTLAAPRPSGAYSQVMIAGDFVYTAGFGPMDPATGQIVGTTVQEQTYQTMCNVRAALRAAGADLDDVVKATVHLADLHRDFDGFNEVYSGFFTAFCPVRTTVGSTLGGILIEVDVVAYRGPDADAQVGH